METEIQLLDLLIKAECGNKTAFAEKIGMTRQNINAHIREAKKKDGKLSHVFKQVLTDHNLDLYRFRRNPTNDFYQTQLPPIVAAKTDTPKMNNEQKIIELLEREIELMKKVKELEKENDVLKSGTPPKKGGRRRSA